MKINKKKCLARHAPESNLHQVEDFPKWKKKKKKKKKKENYNTSLNFWSF